jgi:hypothetical protein
LYNQNSFLLEGESSFAFFCLFFYIPHPLDAPDAQYILLSYHLLKKRMVLLYGGTLSLNFALI